jgi:SnoaL-like protein
MSTTETLARHLAAVAEGNLDAIMSDYTDRSVVITPDGPLRGLAEIRMLFDKIITRVLPPGSAFEMLRREIEGDVAYTVWRGESENFNLLMGTDTFIIREGKIVCQTFAAQIIPKGAFKTMGPPPSKR